jgi:hypothetical protein
VKKRAKKYPRLNDEQLQAIRDFACLNWRFWKRELERIWEKGEPYPSNAKVPDEATVELDVRTLNEIRDQFGVEWLRNYRLPAYMDLI